MSLWNWLPVCHLTGDLAGEPETRPGDPFANLTMRQTEVLVLIARGETNKEIARHLDLLDGTVKMHAKAIFLRLGVRNRAAAAARYTRFTG